MFSFFFFYIFFLAKLAVIISVDESAPDSVMLI